MTPEKLAELEALCEKATPGPWTREKPVRDESGFPMGCVIGGTPGKQTIYANLPGGSFPSADCDFIAASRSALPALIARVRELEAENAELRREA